MAKKAKPDGADVVDVDDALEGELVAAEDSDTVGQFTMFDREWVVLRRPPVMMIARMQRVKANPAALAVFDQLIELCLGEDQYDEFMDAYYAAAPVDGNDADLFADVLGSIMNVVTGRPPA